ncbi:hypothetical protein D1818_16590 [Aquimarina sp. BL5]|uniref:hypothetical protein n=1 Tax=Aquimarina sp. BL5 TaxID=1714860 RepID=UPI000E4FDE81|nr:hypothetical protein [Aquimarina sp. BL5]AXT52379.1 hypothetical protein D1818_16590 [Aquimarina sp. BL5]RKN10293.1 hypothetical protein D7036_02970 [Aquimarina sp. BL5]
MKKIIIKTVIVFILVLISGCASYGPKDNSLAIVLSNTQQALASIGEKIVADGDKELVSAYDTLEKKRSELFPVLEKCNEKYALAPEYITTLKEIEKTVSRVNKEFTTTSDKAFILGAIYKDYDAKLQTIKNTAANNATTKIKVTVNSNEEEGFFVFGKLSYEQGQDIKRFRFNQPTQNAIQDFVPGYYLFWLEKEDRVGEPELHLIMSNSGEEEKQLVLKAPK